MRNTKLYLIGPTESILTKRGNRFPNLANFFDSNGYEIIYYTSNFYHAEKRFFSKKEINQVTKNLNYKLEVLNVLGYYSNVSARRVISNFMFSIFLFFKLLFKISKYDKIILPSRPVELIFFIAILKKFRGCKIYLDIQDIWPDALQIESKIKKKIFEFYCYIFLKPSLRYYTSTFHVAPSFKFWLKRYASKTPSIFVPLGWENERWSNVKSTDHKEHNIIKMVCVAQLQHQIDVIPILKVLKNNHKLHLTILGEDGSGERYEEVISYINSHNIQNINIVGKIERHEMIKYLEDKSIGISPMITSSIPNKIFDYIAAKLPVIVLGENDSSNFVCDNNIGWRCSFNSKDLDDLLKKLNTIDIQSKKNQVILVRDKFSRDILHQKINKIIG